MTIREFATTEMKHLASLSTSNVLGNFFALSSVQVVSYMLPLITVPFLVRTIGLERIGILAFAQSLTGYFITFAEYGFNISATRKIAIERENESKVSEIFSSVLLIKACFIVMSFIILSSLVLTIPRLRSHWIIYVFYFGDVIGTSMFSVWFYQGMQRMQYISFLTLLSRAVFFVSILAIVRKPEDYLYVPMSYALGSLIAGSISLFIVNRTMKTKIILPEAQEVIAQLRDGWHVFISTLAINSYTTTRLFAVGLFTNNTITGYYSIAERLMSIVQFFPLSSILSAVYPKLSEIYAHNPAYSVRIMKRMQMYTTLAHFVFLPIIFFFSPLIVSILAGSAHQEIVVSFRLLLVAVFFINANVFRVHILLVAGRTDIFARIYTVAGVLGIALTFIGTYLFSYIGTAVALIVIALLIWLLTLKFEE